ncbi:uncharacterized protein A1O9_10299 [Exophiala aquamarina CBS 119918]|uniref:Uncharacterized protein n=1 Tax=Exophiala aquamarina CBS 119918 TaxID=1182545 RepID=A0A072P2H1_9EURO|nr:uncharacterized protein A1O9_10299 [Exophiala aquamarina CBS 119918]KEF53897.1 hypothetical protein A1O9_10299 [Exophiala aquamarina CBS 119918]
MAADTEKAKQFCNWRPWQVHPVFLLPLILCAGAIAIVLEVLAEQGNRIFTPRQLLSEWTTWYCHHSDYNDCHYIVQRDTPVFSNTPPKQGFLTFFTPDSLPTSSYFLWIYFPSIIAVLYAIFWEIVDNEVKRIETFYQASSQPTGANASTTIFSEYISLPPFLSPFQAFRWRQWAVLLSSSIYVLVGVVTPILQSQMFQIQSQVMQVGYMYGNGDFHPITEEKFPDADYGSLVGVLWDDPSDYRFPDVYEASKVGLLRNMVYLDPLMARIQVVVLLAVAVLGAILAWILWKRPSGMPGPLKGLGAMTSLASADTEFLRGIFGLLETGTQGTRTSLQDPRKLKVHLGWRAAAGGPVYGFSWTDSTGPDTVQAQLRERNRNGGLIQTIKRKISRAILIRWTVNLSYLACGLLLALIISGLLDGTGSDKTTALDTTVNQGTQNNIGFSVSILVLSVVMKSTWKAVEHEVIAFTPFRALAMSPRSAWPVMARDYSSTPPVAISILAFWDNEELLGIVTLASFLLEVALICFGISASMTQQGQGYIKDDFYNTMWTGFGFCAAALFLMAGSRRTVFVVRPPVQRDPFNIGMQLSYFCYSKRLVNDMKPVAGLRTSKELQNYLQQLNAVCRLGWIPTPTESATPGERTTSDRVQVIERVH